MKETRQRILDTARTLFNTQGLHRVGVREVARAAEVSVGNLAYYFSTKDELVAALITELHERNQLRIFNELPEKFSLVVLYRAAVAAMRSMLDYRFVLLSYVDVLTGSAPLRKLEARLAGKRRERHDRMLAALIRCGYLDWRVRAREAILYEQAMMISSGWLTAAALRAMSDADAVLHFAKLGCALLAPHCTPRGQRQMRQILQGIHDGGEHGPRSREKRG